MLASLLIAGATLTLKRQPHDSGHVSTPLPHNAAFNQDLHQRLSSYIWEFHKATWPRNALHEPPGKNCSTYEDDHRSNSDEEPMVKSSREKTLEITMDTGEKQLFSIDEARGSSARWWPT